MAKFTGEEWSIDQLHDFWYEIDKIGKEEFNLDYDTPQIEIVSSEQMAEAIATIGSPCFYDHWSIGKEVTRLLSEKKRGRGGHVLELIINSKPPVMYIDENNTLIEQGLVLAHAGLGHATVFKNNYLFKKYTSPGSILDYMAYAKDHIRQMESRMGEWEVGNLIDIIKLFAHYGISYRDKKSKKELARRKNATKEELLNLQSNSVLDKEYREDLKRQLRWGGSRDKYNLPEENLLYFIEKHSSLDADRRELVRILRKIEEYFYPQRLTKYIHEGFSSFIQYRVFNRLLEKNIIDEGGYLQFLRSHCSVCFQHSSMPNLNPYAIGVDMFNDLYRMSMEPTKKDLFEYPEICNTDWRESIVNILKNYSDVDFFNRYLTYNVIKKHNLFIIDNNEADDFVTIHKTENSEDDIRQIVSNQLNLNTYIPNLEVSEVVQGASAVYLTAYLKKGDEIDASAISQYFRYLSGFKAVHVTIEEAP